MKKIFTLLLATTITINLFSQVSFVPDQTQGCLPLTVQFTNTSTVGTIYTWDFSDGTNFSGFETSHTFTSTGKYWVSLDAFDNAWNHLGNYQLEIQVLGADTFNCSMGMEICPGEEVRFEFWDDFNWVSWDFGDGNTANNNWVNHTYTTPGTYNVTLIIETQCGIDTIVQQYLVSNAAIPSVGIQTDNTEICPGDQVSFWSNFPATTYYWDFDDGTNSAFQNPSHQFNTLGSKNVTLTVTNACGNSNSTNVFINVSNSQAANAQFYYQQPACPNGLIQFSGLNYGIYDWDFGIAGVSTVRKPYILFTDTGTYPVQLIFTNGCGDTDTLLQDIVVDYDTTNTPQSQISFDMKNGNGVDTIQVCPGEEVRFRNDTWSMGNLYFLWNFNDGNHSYSKDAVHNFSTPGLYEVVMTATNNCNGKDSVSLWVNVDPTTMPNSILMSLPDTICPGENAFFWNESGDIDDENNSYFYSIWYGDGDSLINVTSTPDSMPFFHHQYNNPGTYNYLFTITNMCGNMDSVSGSVFVDSTGSHETFYYYASSADTSSNMGNNNDLPCPGDIVEFWAIGGVSVIWDFGDGTIDTGMHVFHTFPDTGQYTVYLQVTNGCGFIDTLNTIATITDSSFADAWFDVDKEYACANDTISFIYNNDDFVTYGYDFLWYFDDGTTSSQRNPRHAYTSAGDYFVKLVVTNGCGADSSIRMILIDEPNINFVADQNIVPPNTTINFTNLSSNAIAYQWFFGDGDTSAVQNPFHLYSGFGTYNVTLYAMSSVGCTSSVTKSNYIHVHNMQIAQISLTNISCFGEGNGSIDISVSGGQFPYTYQWSNGGTNQHIQNLLPGTYSVTITDTYGASVTDTYSITQPSQITAFPISTDLSCYNTNDGSINLPVTGGSPPYNYIWSNGASTQNINNLASGTYTFTITDNSGCTNSDSIIVNAPASLQVSSNFNNNPTSCGASDGTLSMTVTGGTGALSYLWDSNTGNQTGTIASNLSAGFYTVTVTDITGCEFINSYLLSDPSSITLNVLNQNDISCFGYSDGWATVSVSGTPPFNYLWDNGSIDTVANNLTEGLHFVEISDGLNCLHLFSITISEPDPITVNITHNNPDCFGGYNGSAQVNALGGTVWSDYIYNWSNGSTNSYIINRPAGTYTVTVTDDNNCTATSNVTLSNPPQIQIDMYPNNVSFYGGSDGYMDIIVTNGTPPFTYNWSNGASTEDIGGLSEGVYYVYITDANSCTAMASDTINEPLPLNVNIQSSGTSFCLGNSTVLNAGPGYVTYQWSSNANNAITQAIMVNSSGWYYVTVTSLNSYGVDSIYVDVREPYANQEICIVTIDSASSKNLVVWEKPVDEGIESFNIYKESSYSGVYDSLGNVLFDDMSEYIDMSSNPATVAARYKISVIDTCGNESALSSAHKTMHLTVSTGIGVYNLIWENYEGFTFGSYTVYRGDNSNNLLPIGAIQSTFTTYTDYQPIGLYYYQISVEKTVPCIPTSSAKAQGGPYSHSVSNLEDNGVIPTDVEQLFLSDDIAIYPNPFKNQTTIRFNNNKNNDYTLKLFDVSGKKIRVIENITDNIIQLNREGLPAGFYTVELTGEKTFRGRIIIE